MTTPEMSVRRYSITEASEIAHARRALAAIATDRGFGAEDAGRVALVATEIGSNLVKHGGGGELLVRLLQREQRVGLELLGLDRGAGMTSVAQALRDGYSTGGSPGTGLGAIARQAQCFDIYSQPGRGTAVLAQVWQGARAPAPAPALQIGAVVVPKAGETECGDAWCCRERAGGALLLGIDGLGHGLGAAQAARAACTTFEAEHRRSPAGILQSLHAALRSTRGAAIMLVDIDWNLGRAAVAAVGNMVAAIVDDTNVRHVATDNGIVGHVLPRIRELEYPCDPASVLLLHSDGVRTAWRSQRHPGLLSRHAALIAGVLYRDFRRERDDALVVVVKWSPP